MTSDDLLAQLTAACTKGVNAIRATTELEPVGGIGSKVFPPTYAGSKYAIETRRFERGEKGVSDVVLLDSVQSQANRFEDALLRAWRAGQCSIPVMTVKIPGHDEVTSLNAPHRVSDAIFRDSELGGVMFRESAVGKSVVSARVANATAFYEVCPTALIFGTWDSHGGGGLQSAKIPRALTSEVVGVDVVTGVRTGSRMDPLNIGALTIYKHENGEWTPNDGDALQANGKLKDKWKKISPAEIGHSTIPPSVKETGGVTITEAIQTTVLSFVQLRRLRFPNDTDEVDEQRNIAGRTVLAALSLYAVALQLEEGYDLRSRCFLLPKAPTKFEFVGATSADKDVKQFTVSVEIAKDTFEHAVAVAEKQGLKFIDSSELKMTPSAKLVELVRRSDKTVEPEEESIK